MDKTIFATYKVDDRSYVSFVKREIHNLVINAGFTAHRAGEVDIIVAELTSNLIKYAGGGELLYRLDGTSSESGIYLEIFCIDHGNGISNLPSMMKDGNTTSNSLGQGLGAIERLSDYFQIYTVRAWGTVQHVRVFKELKTAEVQQPAGFDYLVTQICAPGEIVCGDGFYVKPVTNGVQVLVVDGLGHGVKAREAAAEGIAAFVSIKESDPVEIMRNIHAGSKKTRGMVGAVACLDYKAKEWRVCGVGNISVRIYEGLLCKNYTSYNGILGHNIPRTLHETIIPAQRYQTLVMHSDGLRTRWNMADLPSVLKYGPGIISASLYKDNHRGNDDSTVLVAKLNQ